MDATGSSLTCMCGAAVRSGHVHDLQETLAVTYGAQARSMSVNGLAFGLSVTFHVQALI